ncbi:hypothetical protein MASR2M48_00300 [Spirochaetota bacterium]
MNRTLRTTGWIFTGVFLAGYAINVFFILLRDEPLINALLSPIQIFVLGSITLFALSALFDRLNFIQPAVFILSAPFSIIADPQNIYGLGFFIMGILLLERTGALKDKRPLKIIFLGSYLLIIEVISVLLSKRPLADAISPTFYIASFILFLWILYKDKLIIIMKEKKPVLSLSEKSLSIAEKSFVLETLSGKSHKEIASDFELKESTVRNTLARAYKKLDVEDRVGLALIGERFEITD